MNWELFVVLATSLIVWGGLFFYMARLDNRLRDLENRE
jgi:CcmD family protein